MSFVVDAGTRAELWHYFSNITDKDRGASVSTSDPDNVHGLLTKQMYGAKHARI